MSVSEAARVPALRNDDPARRSPLRSLTRRLADDPGFVSMLGPTSGSIAIADSARPFVAAGLATLGRRSPILVVTATASEAERWADDLGTWLGPSGVSLFAAWETLPFERVSPATETMGRRLAVLSALRSGADGGADGPAPPEIIVAPIRALLQRLGSDALADDGAPSLRIALGDRLDSGELVSQLVSWGYRREHQVEHRGEVAVRGGIVDVFCPTAAAPSRVDLWGDEVDRLTEFSVTDQRSVADLAEIRVFPARELRPDVGMRERAAGLAKTEPWCREHMERIASGELFDGMESWLPWLMADDAVLPDLLGPTALVLLVEPRRLADRATDIEAETDDLTRSLAVTWGLDVRAVPDGADRSDRALSAAPRPLRSTVGQVPSSGVVGAFHRRPDRRWLRRPAHRHRVMGAGSGRPVALDRPVARPGGRCRGVTLTGIQRETFRDPAGRRRGRRRRRFGDPACRHAWG